MMPCAGLIYSFLVWFDTGLVNWVLPLTVGNGVLELSYIVHGAAEGILSQHILISSAFARAFLLGISMNCGFIGGPIFPLLSLGLLSGVVLHINFPGVPLALGITGFMVAITGAFIPITFTLVCFAAFSLYLGKTEITPVFVAALTSYIALSASGFLAVLHNFAEARRSPGTNQRNDCNLTRDHHPDQQQLSHNANPETTDSSTT